MYKNLDKANWGYYIENGYQNQYKIVRLEL